MTDYCLEFLGQAIEVILGGMKEPITDPYIRDMILYSGKQFNDQGDLSACLRAPQMNFIESKLVINGAQLFRGLCIKDVCNAQYFTDHSEDIAQMVSFLLKAPVNSEDLFFTQYPVTKPSPDNSGFITISIVLGIIFLLIFASAFIQIYQKIKSKYASSSKSQQNANLEKGNANHEQGYVDEELISRNTLSSMKNDNIQDISMKANLLQKNQQQKTEQKKGLKAKSSGFQQSFFFKLIDCWNTKSNIQKIFQINVRNTDLLSFECIRVLSFLQVILGHEFLIRISYYYNINDLLIIQGNTFTLFIFSCFYSVDVFFLLGGFFVAYVSADPKIMQHLQIKKFGTVVTSYFMAIINRVFRILPSYFVALFIMWQYVNYAGDSPTWGEMEFFTGLCDDSKWKKLLFIDNLYDQDTNCFAWSWYLSNDMQMFIGSMILMIVYANNKKLGKIIILIALAAFTGVAIYYAFDYELIVVSQLAALFNPNWTMFYYKPWCRFPPYLLGLIFGILYKEYALEKSKPGKSSFLSKIAPKLKETYWKWISYIFGLGIILLLQFGPRPLQVNGIDYWNQDLQHFLFGISRVVYAFGVVLILLPSVCGSKDLLVRVMSAKIFQFVSKLTFQGYLFHYTFLTYSLWDFKDTLYISNENIICLYIAELVIILVVSFFFLFLIEMPFNNLANLLFNKQKPKPVEQKNENIQSQNKQNQNVS